MTDVVTVRGPINVRDLGLTLPHEHVFVNLTREYRGTGLLNDYALMVEEVNRFAEAGGKSIIDVTPPELSHGAAPDPAGVMQSASVPTVPGASFRDPANLRALRDLSVETGVNILVGTGHYRDPYLDRQWFEDSPVAAIAEQLVEDIEIGIAGTGIRAGVIGEVGTDKWFISETEHRSLLAAAAAHRATGVTITTHANRWPVGVSQLELLEAEGVDPRRVIIGHCDTVHADGYQMELAQRGAFVQFDHCRVRTSRQLKTSVKLVIDMVRNGYIDQLLLSSDVCLTTHLASYGGGGFSYIPTTYRDILRDEGISDDEFEQICVDNPQRALTGAE